MIEKEQAKHEPGTSSTPDGAAGTKWSDWRPSVMCNDEGTFFWMEDAQGFVKYSWSKEEADTIDAVSWKDLDQSEDFKDYVRHLKP